MIEKNSAFKVFEINMERTNILIQAVEKISAYNFLYQEKAYNISPDHRNIVKAVQDKELEKISNSCYEHAIISIATTFETYLKELVQELLFKHGDYFLNRNSKWKERINALINDSEKYDFEIILNRLNLRNRFQTIEFLDTYNLVLLTPDQENLINSIYIKRNNFVHNGSKLSKKAKTQITELNEVDKEKYFDLSIKWTRTKFKRMMIKVHENIFQKLNE